MDLRRELVDQANADLKDMALEPSPAKRAWLGGRAQVLLSLANTIGEDLPSPEEVGAKVETLLSKAADSAKTRGRGEDAQYDIGKIAGLNLVRRLLRTDHRD